MNCLASQSYWPTYDMFSCRERKKENPETGLASVNDIFRFATSINMIIVLREVTLANIDFMISC